MSEAFWRLQLVTTEDFSKQFGSVSSQYFVNDDDWIYNSGESDSEDETNLAEDRIEAFENVHNKLEEREYDSKLLLSETTGKCFIFVFVFFLTKWS